MKDPIFDYEVTIDGNKMYGRVGAEDLETAKKVVKNMHPSGKKIKVVEVQDGAD